MSLYIHIDKWLAIARSGSDGPDGDARTVPLKADMGSKPTCP